MRLAKSDLVTILGDLAAALPGSKDRDIAALIEGYYGALEDCGFAEVKQAAAVVVKEDRFFPPASRLRRLVFDLRKEHPTTNGGEFRNAAERMLHWALHGMTDGTPCPYCGSVLEDREGKRLHVYHDEARHREQRAPIIGNVA